jgi:hypothetical protein
VVGARSSRRRYRKAPSFAAKSGGTGTPSVGDLVRVEGVRRRGSRGLTAELEWLVFDAAMKHWYRLIGGLLYATQPRTPLFTAALASVAAVTTLAIPRTEGYR